MRTVLMNMLAPEYDSQAPFLLRQVPSSSGCHDFRIGAQKKRFAQKDQIPHPTIRNIRNHKVSLVLPPVNIRWY